MADEDFTTIDAFKLEQDTPGERVSLVLYHREGSELVSLPPSVPIIVGRKPPADVAIADPSLSRQHARFWREDEKVFIEDLDSTNGTRVNGKKISSSSRIRPGDDVRLGAVAAAVHLLAERDPELAGIDSHDTFVATLEEEILRARTFGRHFVLLMVRAAKRSKGHVSGWAPRVRGLLRPVDRAALYGPESLILLLPESEIVRGLSLIEQIQSGRRKGEPTLLFGLAGYPESATSAEELLEVVRDAALHAKPRQPIVTSQPTERGKTSSTGQTVVVNEQMKMVYRTIERVASAQIPVLIQGETGTGKEVVAQAVHKRSGRRGPLRCINCGAIPKDLIESTLFGHERGAFTGASEQKKGLFEEAQGGSVLLDEIGELSPAAQAALLRVLETKRIARVGSSKEIEVDVRILAATHRDLEEMAERGEFRQDLLYRLNTMMLELPPLRDRREEILPFAEHFIRVANKANGCSVRAIDEQAQQLLQRYDWPGNVRELRNVIERAVVIAQDQTVTPADLSQRVRKASRSSNTIGRIDTDDGAGLDIKAKVRRYEAQLLLQALEEHGWNQTETAQALGMPLRTLVHKIKVYGIKKRYDV